MPKITCTAPVFQIDSYTITHLPKTASSKLPSRGLVMVTGTINNTDFTMPLEPDGKGSHWFAIDKKIMKSLGNVDQVKLVIESTNEWTEPTVPTDLKQAINATPHVKKVWQDITPMARWDWIRWIRSTNNAETRKKRIHVACSKMTSGSRRPCCFNRNMCTEPAVAKSGVLREPTRKI